MKEIKIKKDNFYSILLIVAFLFLCLGYGWRMSQEASNENRAFEAGQEACMKEFKAVLLGSASTIYYKGFHIVPRVDGRYTIGFEK